MKFRNQIGVIRESFERVWADKELTKKYRAMDWNKLACIIANKEEPMSTLASAVLNYRIVRLGAIISGVLGGIIGFILSCLFFWLSK